MSTFLTFLIVSDCLSSKKFIDLMSGELLIHKCHCWLYKVSKHEISREKTSKNKIHDVTTAYNIFSYSIPSLQENCYYKLSTCFQHHLNILYTLIISPLQSLISNSSCKRSEKDISVSKLVKRQLKCCSLKNFLHLFQKFITDLLDRAKTLWADVEIDV